MFSVTKQENLTMKKTVMLLALACVMAAPAVFAQTSDATSPVPNAATRTANMVQHRVAYMTTVLSLTTAQQTQVTNVLTNAASNRSTTHTSMKAAHDALKTAVHSNDAAAMEQASNTIGALAAQEALAHAKTEAAIYQLLTPEQQTKMTQLESEGHRGGPGFGHGGPVL
jgi:Spy/CpxP family protein refolding chaperone